MFSPEFSGQLPILTRLFTEGGDCIEYNPRKDDHEGTQFAAEIDNITKQAPLIDELLKNIYPGGVPRDVNFYNMSGHRLAGIVAGSGRVSLLEVLWIAALSRLSKPDRQQVLNAITQPSNHWFFEALSAMPNAVRKLALAADFVAPWLIRLRARLGNDLASGSFWLTVEAYCQTHPLDAVSILEQWARIEPKDDAAGLTAHVLGELRQIISDGGTKDQFSRAEAIFEHSLKPHMRSIYLQSWSQSATRTDLSETTVSKLRAVAFGGTTEEIDTWFHLLSRLPIIDVSRYAWALQMMEEEASSELTDSAKHYFVTTVCHLGRIAAKATHGQERRILLKIMPLSAHVAGTWGLVFGNMDRALKNNDPEALQYVLTIAEKSAASWLAVIAQPQMRGSGLRAKTEVITPLITSLLLSGKFEARRLGLHYFSALAATQLSNAQLDAAGATTIEIIFLECQRTHMAPDALGRLFGILWPRVHKIGGDFLAEFLHEVGLQARSTKGFRDGLAPTTVGAPELATVIAEAEHYFEALKKSRNSAAFQIRIAGWGNGRRLHDRKFSREVSESAKKHSLLAHLAREIAVLYARRWTVITEGRFGESSEMQDMTVSSEVPRLEFMDEEGMLWRRLVASRRIQNLEEESGAA
jgi:hypothetical protein